jgi:hypothetical protein
MNELIFQPMMAVVTLTAVVWFAMYVTRVRAMRQAGKPVQAYTVPDRITEFLPEKANYPANNFKNLFELPVLFYVMCIYLYVTGNVDVVYMIAAWLFAGLRVLHSLVHCTVNIVILRFQVYFAGGIVLWFMLARIAVDLFRA